MKERKNCSTRRRFFRVIGGAAMGVGLSSVFGCAAANNQTGQAEAHGPLAGGNVSGLPVGKVRVLDNHPVILIRDGSGLYAMSTICTHAQCDMRNDGVIGADGLDCACHGSQFDTNGDVVRGPARAALRHFLVEVDEFGEVTIQADQLVDASARTPVPASVTG
jgi:Rieske Fe-S protein